MTDEEIREFITTPFSHSEFRCDCDDGSGSEIESDSDECIFQASTFLSSIKKDYGLDYQGPSEVNDDGTLHDSSWLNNILP